MYGQRDPKWKDSILGNGTTTIGGYGCTITSLANLFEKNGYDYNPQQVNDLLKANGGFSGSYIVWAGIQKAFPFVTNATRIYSYDNAGVSETIVKYGGCLVEVKANPIGVPNGKHWVLFTGDQRCYDPWFNNETSTASWEPTGYAIIQLTKKPVADPCDEVRKEMQKEINDKNVQIGNLQEQVNKLVPENQRLSTELGNANGEKQQLISKVESLNNIVGEYQKDDAVQIKDLQEAQTKANMYSDKYFVLLKEIRYLLKLSTTIDDATTAENEAYSSLQTVYQRLTSAENDLKDLQKELKACADFKKWKKLSLSAKIKLLFS